MNRPLRYLILVIAFAIVCWLFPLFHIVSLKTAVAEKAAVTFNPAAFAESFWTNQLAASFAQAIPAATLVPAIAANPAAAKKKYSRSVGLSDAYFYFLSGSGTVTAVSDDEISLALTPGSTNADVILEAGLVFGNAIRDGTGLLNASDYPNSQDFNDLSAALNHLVETRVLPPLKAQAKVGATLSFFGCVEVDDESSDLKSLKIIPIQTKIQ